MIVDGDWMKILLVYNPAAGHGKTGRALPEIDRRFRNLGIEAEITCLHHAISVFG